MADNNEQLMVGQTVDEAHSVQVTDFQKFSKFRLSEEHLTFAAHEQKLKTHDPRIFFLIYPCAPLIYWQPKGPWALCLCLESAVALYIHYITL